MEAVFETWRDQVVVKLQERNAEQHLQRWLEGVTLPSIDSYTEGHTWLLEATEDDPDLKRRLSALTAKLLESYFLRKIQSEDLTRLQFNLFYLCAGLREPEILCALLLQVLKAQTVPASSDDLGEYQGVPLIAAFRAALAGNQADNQMLEIWSAMLEDKPHYYLGGGPMDGFEGVMGLPGRPKEALVGWAIARMSDYLDDNPYRKDQIEQLIASVQSRFTDYKWDFELLAARCEWKLWAQKLVGNPQDLVKIDYADIARTEYLRGTTKSRIRIRLPLKYKTYAARLNPIIRQLALDFCKEPPPDGTLVPLVEHLLPSDKYLPKKTIVDESGPPAKGPAANRFAPVVQSLRKNEEAA